MGIKNRQRRAAKARRRARDHDRPRGRPHRGAPDDGPHDRPAPAEAVRRLIELGATAPSERADEYDAIAIPALVEHEPRLVDGQFERSLTMTINALWRNGWQPAELVRHARRVDGRTGRLVAMAVSADAADRDPRTLHPRWSAQLTSLALPNVDASGWLARFAQVEALGRRAVLTAAITALRALCQLGPLAVVVPPPGADTSSSRAPRVDVDDPVLGRVRALLAQAESTTFEAEAETFTLKAQELMARHAIDAAMVWARSARDERPASIRLPIDDPYADIKSLLLQHVAKHSRCRAVYHPSYALSTVVGFASDVASTELLFTSLLVQAQTAMQAEAATAGPGGRARSRSFRSSFLLAYTHRIDQRLQEVADAVRDAMATERDDAHLPVLVERDDAVSERVDELFGPLASSPVRGGYDGAGWGRGTLAADLARLTRGDLDGATPKPDAGALRP